MNNLDNRNHEIIRLCDRPELSDAAAVWFHEKWGIPEELYAESIADCVNGSTVPQWYAVLCDGKIIAGLGVIENDFHSRKDLSPNICAVYVEEKYRRLGIAGEMLGFVCEDMKKRGFDTLYLITDHTGFYEKYNWEFFCMADCDDEDRQSRIYIHRN